MTFEEALNALWEGKVLRRHGWDDENKFCYLTLQEQDGGVTVYTANASADDAMCNDWYVWGWVH